MAAAAFDGGSRALGALGNAGKVPGFRDDGAFDDQAVRSQSVVMLRISHGAFQRFADQCCGFFRHEIEQVQSARGGQTLNFASDFPRLEGRDALLTGDGSDFQD